MKPISIYEYIIANNSSAIRPLMSKYGKNYPNTWGSTSETEKQRIIARTMQEMINDTDFRNDLLSLHPDTELFEEHFKSQNSTRFHKAEGEDIKPEVKVVEVQKESDNKVNIPSVSNIMIGVGAGFIAIYLLKNILK